MEFIWSAFKRWRNRDVTNCRILILGLDNAGKSTMLYRLKFNETITTMPHMGFLTESIQPEKGLQFNMYDITGQAQARRVWRFFYHNTDGLIYVVDSSERERLAEARRELQNVLADREMRGVPVLVVANKQDLPDTVVPRELAVQLDLTSLSDRKWHIQEACAYKGDGLKEAIAKLATMVKEFKAR